MSDQHIEVIDNETVRNHQTHHTVLFDRTRKCPIPCMVTKFSVSLFHTDEPSSIRQCEEMANFMNNVDPTKIYQCEFDRFMPPPIHADHIITILSAKDK